MADKKERQQYLKFREMANDLRKAEHWDKLDGVLNRNKTVQNLYKMGYRKLSFDVVEVVRCGKCKYFNQSKEDECAGTCNHPMFGLSGRICKSDFCSYGERRTDNDL